MACQALRACRRPGQAAGPLPSCLTSVQLRGQQTLGSASLPLARHSVRHVRALDEERLMEVEWEDGGHSLYPFTWLRDNCQCPLCTLESAQARKLLMSDLDIHTGVDVLEVTNDNKVGCCHDLTCVFGGSHIQYKGYILREEDECLNYYPYWMCKCRIHSTEPTSWFNINFL